jgi:hypothetical protein
MGVNMAGRLGLHSTNVTGFRILAMRASSWSASFYVAKNVVGACPAASLFLS